jgi:proline iminopeptidase
MQILFPELKPYKRHQVKVTDKHELYVDEAGNVAGMPILFIHGGSGGACDASSRRFYDPVVYRIITFDQRGCGRSTPNGELENNTTHDLIADIEVIREFLDRDRWVLFGGSWGSTLGLLHARAFPARVLALILRGIFLCRQCDLVWPYKDGARRVFPDFWEEFVNHILLAEGGDLMKAYYERITGDDELAQMAAAKYWSAWEGSCSKLRPSPEALASFTKPHNALALARLEIRYFMNKGFIDENHILDGMQLIRDIPCRMVHGRYNMVCPLENALALHRQWPEAELHIVRESGHSASEPETVDALILVTQGIAKTLEAFD